ncbi:MAG TPA: A/G-specific adenine glycosylase [Sphingobium sp.]|nr:A/G-specific adenine glycosylase [Sphingobium sp.]
MLVDCLSPAPAARFEDIAAEGIPLRLLAHYDATARSLPWRMPPGSNAADPYRVWLSEIMLQQTTVAAVIPYFETFTRRWPTVADLAAAADADVMSAWAGLGYYARARNLIACARSIMADHGGRFPDTEDGLRTLPGIGAYTAAAIAAIAFGRRAVVVDANVERVVARLCAIERPLPAARPDIRAAADAVTPALRSGDFAQAMMDLGSAICTPRAPRCGECPLRSCCAAQLTDDPARFPVKAPKAARPEHRGTAWWIERQGAVWLIRRPARGLLGGMRALPGSSWGKAADGALPFAGDWRRLASPVRHIFTHFALELDIACVTIDADPPVELGEEGGWWPVARICEAGLPTLFARAAAAAIKGED